MFSAQIQVNGLCKFMVFTEFLIKQIVLKK